MSGQSGEQSVFHAVVAGKPCRKFIKRAAFNAYAHDCGYTQPVQGDYLGGLVWRHPANGLIMELCAE